MKKIAILSIFVLTPAVTLAANTIEGILITIGDILSLATPIVVALALVFFFYGLAKYILNTGDEEKKGEGKSIMIWGIIALFVMVSVWGLVNIISDTFNIDRDKSVFVPFVENPTTPIR